MTEKTYIDFLEEVAACDVAGLKRAQQSYGDSWKKRGGVGAFMMLARKWDRLEQQLGRLPKSGVEGLLHMVSGPARYDIFEHAELDRRTEGVIDDVRDLRRYLMLVEAELIARGVTHDLHRDNLPTAEDLGSTVLRQGPSDCPGVVNPIPPVLGHSRADRA